MAIEIYKEEEVFLVDGTSMILAPLKIVYLKRVMDRFSLLSESSREMDKTEVLVSCALVAMKQYRPEIDTVEKVEDVVDIDIIYKILDIGAGITMKEQEPETKAKDAKGKSDWASLDLASLEAEVFLLGIWKSYEELELSISMPELIATLESQRKSDYDSKKFFAAIQGVDIDKNSSKGNEWEEMKARVFSGNKTDDPNDILAYQGVSAQKAGFGINMGLSYEKID
jgi:hypothetical protein